MTTTNSKSKRVLRKRATTQFLKDAEDLHRGLKDPRVQSMFDPELIRDIRSKILSIYLDLCDLYKDVKEDK